MSSWYHIAVLNVQEAMQAAVFIVFMFSYVITLADLLCHLCKVGVRLQT